MPVFDIDLDDGRRVQVRSARKPSKEEVLAEVGPMEEYVDQGPQPEPGRVYRSEAEKQRIGANYYPLPGDTVDRVSNIESASAAEDRISMGPLDVIRPPEESGVTFAPVGAPGVRPFTITPNRAAKDIAYGKKVGTAILQDSIAAAAGMAPETPEESETFNAVRFPGPTPGQLAKEKMISELPVAARIPTRALDVFANTAPDMLIAAGLQTVGVPFPATFSALMGSTEEGFDPKGAALGLIMPASGRVAGELLPMVAKKYFNARFTDTLHRLSKMGHFGGSIAPMAAADVARIESLPPEQRRDAYIDSIGSMLGIGAGMAGMLRSGNAPLLDIKREADPRLARLLQLAKIDLEKYPAAKAEYDAIENSFRESPMHPQDQVMLDAELPKAAHSDGTPIPHTYSDLPRGSYMRWNRQSNTIEIDPAQLSSIMEYQRRRGMTESDLAEWIKRSVNEEVTHSRFTGEQAARIGSKMSSADKKMMRYIYHGDDKVQMSDADYGDEFLRYLAQKSSGMGAREMAEMALSSDIKSRLLDAASQVYSEVANLFTKDPTARETANLLNRVSQYTKEGEQNALQKREATKVSVAPPAEAGKEVESQVRQQAETTKESEVIPSGQEVQGQEEVQVAQELGAEPTTQTTTGVTPESVTKSVSAPKSKRQRAVNKIWDEMSPAERRAEYYAALPKRKTAAAVLDTLVETPYSKLAPEIKRAVSDAQIAKREAAAWKQQQAERAKSQNPFAAQRFTPEQRKNFLDEADRMEREADRFAGIGLDEEGANQMRATAASLRRKVAESDGMDNNPSASWRKQFKQGREPSDFIKRHALTPYNQWTDSSQIKGQILAFFNKNKDNNSSQEYILRDAIEKISGELSADHAKLEVTRENGQPSPGFESVEAEEAAFKAKQDKLNTWKNILYKLPGHHAVFSTEDTGSHRGVQRGLAFDRFQQMRAAAEGSRAAMRQAQKEEFDNAVAESTPRPPDDNPSAHSRVTRDWKELQDEDLALQDRIKQWITGDGNYPSAPSVIYRGVPNGADFKEAGHASPWAFVAARGGKGPFGDPRANDVYEMQSSADRLYYRGGALRETPFESTRIMNASGMTWDQVLKEGKRIFDTRIQRRIKQVKDEAATEGFSQDWIDDVIRQQIEMEADAVVHDIRMATFETDINNVPGRWSSGNLEKRFNRPRPVLASRDDVARMESPPVPTDDNPRASTRNWREIEAIKAKNREQRANRLASEVKFTQELPGLSDRGALESPKPIEERGQVQNAMFATAKPEHIEATAKSMFDNTLQKKGVPSYDDFVNGIRSTMADVSEGQLHDLWQDTVWKSLNAAKGEEVVDLINKLQLRRQLGVREGKLEIEDSVPLAEESNSAMQIRANAIEAADKMLKHAKYIEQGVVERAGELPMMDRQTLRDSDAARVQALRAKANEILERARRIEQEPGQAVEVARQVEMFGPTGEATIAKTLADKSDVTASTGKQKFRKRAIALIANELESRSNAGMQEKLNRSDITVDDIRWNSRKEDGASWFTISPSELEDAATLARELTIGAGSEASTQKIIGGGRAKMAVEALPRTASKRLVALLDSKGRVHLVSTYRRSGEPMAVDPIAPGREHVSLEGLINRGYQPIYSALLDEPVKAFYKRYESIGEFNDKLAREANDRMHQSMMDEGAVVSDKVEPSRELALDEQGNLVRPGLTSVEEGEGGSTVGPNADLVDIASDRSVGALESGFDMTGSEARTVVDKFRDATNVGEAVAVLDDVLARADQWRKNVDSDLYRRLEDRKDVLLKWKKEVMNAATPEQQKRATKRMEEAQKQVDALQASVGEPPTPSDRLFLNALAKAAKKTQRWFEAEKMGDLLDVMQDESLRNEAVGTLYNTSKAGSYFVEGRYGERAERGPAPMFMRPSAPEKGVQRELTLKRKRVIRGGIDPAAEAYRKAHPVNKAAVERAASEAAIKKAAKIRKQQPEPSALEKMLEQRANDMANIEEEIAYTQWLQDRAKTSVAQEREVYDPDLTTAENAEWRRANRKEIGLDVYGNPKASIRAAAAKALNWTSDAVMGVGSRWDEWMIPRLRRIGGPESQRVAEDLERVNDQTKVNLGSLTPTLDPALEAAGGSTSWPVVGRVPSLKLVKAVKSLNEIQWTGSDGVRRVVDAIEGKINPKDLTPDEWEVVRLGQVANLDIGAMYAKGSPGFVPTGLMARMLTGDGYDILLQGEGDNFNAWAEGIARRNGFTKKYVVDEMRKWRDELLQEVPDISQIDKVAQDFSRRFPHAVTHLKGKLGSVIEVVHSDLYNYLRTASQRASHVAALRSMYPLTAAGKAKLSADVQAVNDELSARGVRYQGLMPALMRALQGRPTDVYKNSILPPTSPGANAFRFVNQTLGNTLSKMVLTGQMLVQPGETLSGATPMALGYKNYIRAAARLGQLYSQMESDGAVNRVMYDYTLDPGRRTLSGFRATGNVISKAFAEQFLNEAQEGLAAATAYVVSERIMAGTLSKWERRNLPQTFRMMGFSPSEAKSMMAGDPELLGMFRRRAAAVLTSGNKTVAESSKLGGNRLFNSIFRFNSYPMMKAQQFRRISANMLDAWANNRPDKGAATEQFARMAFFNTMQGALTVAIGDLVKSAMAASWGPVEQRKNEFASQWPQFLLESFMASIGGPLYLMWRAAEKKGVAGIPNAAARMAFPYAIGQDLLQMANSEGPYKDKDVVDRIVLFLKQKTPASEYIGGGLALAGLGSKDAELDAAIMGYYRWLNDEKEGKDRKEFRINMRSAIDAAKRGDEAGKDRALEKAYDVTGRFVEAGKGGAAAASSLRSRKILKDKDGQPLSPEKVQDLVNRIGVRAYDKLDAFDTMLEEAAKSYSARP